MVKYENECVGCPPDMGCMGLACKYRNVPHFFCDQCGEEMEASELYDVDGEMLCADCILKQYKTIEETGVDV